MKPLKISHFLIVILFFDYFYFLFYLLFIFLGGPAHRRDLPPLGGLPHTSTGALPCPPAQASVADLRQLLQQEEKAFGSYADTHQRLTKERHAAALKYEHALETLEGAQGAPRGAEPPSSCQGWGWTLGGGLVSGRMLFSTWQKWVKVKMADMM